MEEKKAIAAKEVCILAQGTIIEGSLETNSNIRLEGELHGELRCGGRLVMAPKSKVMGQINCKELISEGESKGNVKAKSLVYLQASAQLTGDIDCERLQIEQGAIFNGQCTMPKDKA
ncbi:polymer-forming cytoskeletal protein [Saprospira sp. CCB-QB6]|uniref:bactofilin family protein n=1 Tax=Saprospira sp. CCB-QB6 TaxID=3023936 RepID=UPI00234ADB91|nr:polymer-forming cytoskeletal protein [Saprospira sp. CCB-QB6]WCL82332.1 polymer-forming cytoskeletal protein [Saprospira sp. CCB-QB6]